MITPAGADCPLYYEDFARGASVQECRAAKAPGSQTWRPADCAACPVPSIRAANGSDWLALSISIVRRPARRARRVDVSAWCTLHELPVPDPIVGCSECNAASEELLRRAFE